MSDPITELLNWARLAPSAHNLQPWLVTASKSARTLVVSLNPKFANHPTDPHNRQAFIGLGCFVQTLFTACKAFDYSYTYTISHATLPTVTIHLSNLTSSSTNQQLLDTIAARRAYRGEYASTHTLTKSNFATLSKLDYPKHVSVHLSQDPKFKLNLAELQSSSNRAALMRPEFRHELAHQLAVSTNITPRSVPGSTFGLSDASTTKIIASLSSDHLDGDFAAGFANADRDAIAAASLVGIISTATDTPTAWLNAGLALQKIWLHLAQLKLGVSVMAGLVESPSFRLQLQTLLSSGFPQTVFRAGFPLHTGWPHSPRLATSDFLTFVN